MSDEENISEDLTLESKSWRQMEKNLQQFGYREGASKGRDSTFQFGFDKGYVSGFEQGKALGQARGILSCIEGLELEDLNAIKKNVESIVDKIVKVPCIVCLHNKEDELYQLTFKNIVSIQEKYKIQVFEAAKSLKTIMKAGQG